MKKAKIFLTALTVLAVVGGALAFKAKQPRQFAFCNTASGICELNTFTTFTIKETQSGGAPADYDVLGHACVSTIPNGPLVTCTTLTTTTKE
ncbi:hypothetical protein [Niastella sp. OAS944]|uniref:hypothetical protein n=1 Tax=Niastella sp. OAS944 TaxID=2664089 RepID=UPI00347BC840|nr:hypothetical protein [Chitinophagaceae bacterium OAS944]